MDEQQKKTLAALYAHWSRRIKAVGPGRAEPWLNKQQGLVETLDVLGYKIVWQLEFPYYNIVEKPS